MKVLSKFSILLVYLLISSIFARHPHPQKNSKYNNTTYDYNRKNTNYNYHNHINDYNKFKRNGCCPLKLVLGAILINIWFALLILYFLVNRRKKTFNVMLNNRENNLSNYVSI